MADGDNPEKRQRGGRQKMRDARVGVEAGVSRPYIVRGIPTYDILSDESLSKIEATADRILAEIGIELRDDVEAMQLYKAAGAEVTETTQNIWRIKFPPTMLRDIPNPIASGVRATDRTRSTKSASPSDSASRAPVTPVSETR